MVATQRVAWVRLQQLRLVCILFLRDMLSERRLRISFRLTTRSTQCSDTVARLPVATISTFAVSFTVLYIVLGALVVHE